MSAERDVIDDALLEAHPITDEMIMLAMMEMRDRLEQQAESRITQAFNDGWAIGGYAVEPHFDLSLKSSFWESQS